MNTEFDVGMEFSKFPSEVVEKMLNGYLNGTEIRVLLFIVHQMYKEKNPDAFVMIPKSKFMKSLHVPSDRLFNCIRKLRSDGIVEVREGKSGTNEYKAFHKWCKVCR